jgi:hypothetical protein
MKAFIFKVKNRFGMTVDEVVKLKKLARTLVAERVNIAVRRANNPKFQQRFVLPGRCRTY